MSIRSDVMRICRPGRCAKHTDEVILNAIVDESINLEDEYNRIKNRTSTLPRAQRDAVVRLFEKGSLVKG